MHLYILNWHSGHIYSFLTLSWVEKPATLKLSHFVGLIVSFHQSTILHCTNSSEVAVLLSVSEKWLCRWCLLKNRNNQDLLNSSSPHFQIFISVHKNAIFAVGRNDNKIFMAILCLSRKSLNLPLHFCTKEQIFKEIY